MPSITPDEFKVIKAYVHSISGIFLEDSKAYLVENRFGPLLSELGLTNFADLYLKAKSDASGLVQRKIIDAITTNETLFFRDQGPFELLQHKILPDLVDRRSKKVGASGPISIRIWSAACSTGQEVYSICMVLKELLGDLNKYNIRLLGTDISDAAVAKASKGFFGKFEIERGLPREKLTRYFTPDGDQWKIRDELRALATFRKLNLLENFTALGKFDIILCRNVAIYFSDEDRVKLFARLTAALEGDGYLMVGGTESLSGVCPELEARRYLRSVFYQKRDWVAMDTAQLGTGRQAGSGLAGTGLPKPALPKPALAKPALGGLAGLKTGKP